MKRIIVLFLLAVLGLQSVAPADAARRTVVRRAPRHRTVVVVHRGWPIRRPLRTVVVYPARRNYRVMPTVFLPVVVWSGTVIASPPPHDVYTWEDSETLNGDDDWSEFTLNSDSRGTKLWLQVTSGKVQFDWAEITFENGEARVVDMKEWTRGAGMYPLLDFADGRMVDHVRVVARAKSDEAKVVLKMQK